MCEPRNRDNGASDVWALTAYTNRGLLKFQSEISDDLRITINYHDNCLSAIYVPLLLNLLMSVAVGRTPLIKASRCMQGRLGKNDVMLKIRKNIHIKSTECPFLKVFNVICSLRYMASKSSEKIGQNRVLV